MARDQSNDEEETDRGYAQLEVAAPIATEAVLVKHPTEGWCRVLDGETEIEQDQVSIMLGGLESGTFQGWYRTWYSEWETVVLPADHEIVGEHEDAPAKSTSTADHLVPESMQH